ARGPFGRNAAPTRAIRNAIRAAGLRTPVVCTGGVHNFEMAESWLGRAYATSSAQRGSLSPIRTGR
ncbi:MAG: hypothetical protein WAK41_00770, partial [Roseiarcus sp.]